MSDWSTALQTQLDLLNWWTSEKGKAFGYGFGNSIATQYEKKAYEDALAETGSPALATVAASLETEYRNLNDARHIAEHQALTLDRAATYYVEADMVAFAHAAAQTMGEEVHIAPDLLPHPRGFIYLDGGIPMVDINGEDYIVHAIVWNTDALDELAEGEIVRGIDYVLYSDLRDERETNEFAREYRAGMSEYGTAWAPFHANAIKFGDHSWPDPEQAVREDIGQYAVNSEDVTDDMVRKAAAATIEIERWLVAFWMLVDEPIVDQRHRPARRAVQRRAKRVNLDSPDELGIRVITLRHITDPNRLPQDPNADDGEAWVNWSHRWYVNPHWRRIHKGTDQERLVRVRGYVKGPENAPLIIRDTVYKWER